MGEGRGGFLRAGGDRGKKGGVSYEGEFTSWIEQERFLKGTAVGAGTLGLMGVSAGKTEAMVGLPKKWAMEADVVIIGFGGAGACAAIEAADAKVLILEKQPKETPLSQHPHVLAPGQLTGVLTPPERRDKISG